jgi:solute:Na+ symporter, SSS family
MRFFLPLLIGFFITLPVSGNGNGGMAYESIQWSIYSALPFKNGTDNRTGLAGTFSGFAGDRLVIAGGAGLSGSPAGDKGEVNYRADIYILSPDDPESMTLLPGALPRGIAFGVSVTLPQGVLIIGGSDDRGPQQDVFLLSVTGEGNEITLAEWPSLPVPLAGMTGTVINNMVFIAGGYDDNDGPRAGNHFYGLDLRNIDMGWVSIEPWPGPPRSFAVSAGQSDGLDNCFYLFGGVTFGGGLNVEFQQDGYKYNPQTGEWRELDVSGWRGFPATGGVSFSSGANHIVFAGGINGAMVQEMKDSGEGQIINRLRFPRGINRNVLFYHTITNTMIIQGDVDFPVSLTPNVIKARGMVFIPGWHFSPPEVMVSIIQGEFLYMKRSIGFWYVLIMVLYLAVLTLMGWYFYSRQKNTTDYFKGGGKIPWWAVALSIYGTTLSTITFMAIPSKTFSTDWSYLAYNFGMITAVPVVILLFIPFYRKLNITTAYEYIELRFSLTVRILTSVAFMVFQVGRMAIVLFLPAIAINIITGFDIFLSIILMGIISLIYTSLGGIEAVIWTDVLQVMVLFGGAIMALILLSFGVEDGFRGIVSTASADGKFQLADTRIDFTSPTLLTALIATFFANLTTYGTDQTVVQRYMTTSTEKMAVRSVWGKLVAALPGSALFFFIGTAMYVFYKHNPAFLSFTNPDQDSIFPWFIFTQMPQGLSAVLLSGIFAAAMSTVSSSINSAATAYSVDIHYRFGWSASISGLRVARIASALFGLAGTLLALMMATWEIVSLWDQFIKILGLLMGSFGGLFLLGLLTRRANATGALIGIIASILVQVWIDQNQIVHVLLYVATGSLTCFIVGYLASLVTPPEKKDISNLTISKSKDSGT